MKQIKERNLNKNNETPFDICLEKDSNKMGEILISAGAGINAKDIIYQYIRVLLLIKMKQIKERNLNKNNRTPLLYAKDNLKQLLLSKGTHQ